jgi:hypothetical protein
MSDISDYLLSLGGELLEVVPSSRRVAVPVTRSVPDNPVDAYSNYHSTREAGTGLSTCHNSPQLISYSGSRYLKVQTGRRKPDLGRRNNSIPVPIAKRGRITGFSKKSRLRMVQELSKLRSDARAILLTLTYPGEYSDDPVQWKNDLDNFMRRLARKFPGVSGVWKLEPQKRGAPHFHLLVWGAEYMDLLTFVPWSWYEVVGSGDLRHLQAGTRVERVRSYRGTMFYASKYLGKEITAADWGHAGRWWGVFGREHLPYGQMTVMEISERQSYELIRYMRRFARIRGFSYKSLTINCDADQWVGKLFPQCTTDPPPNGAADEPPETKIRSV